MERLYLFRSRQYRSTSSCASFRASSPDFSFTVMAGVFPAAKNTRPLKLASSQRLEIAAKSNTPSFTVSVCPFWLSSTTPLDAAARTQKCNRNQVHHALRGVSVPVDDFVQQIVCILLRADGRHAAVQIHALLAGGNVALRNVRRHIEVRRAFRLLERLFPALLEYCVFEQFEIHIVADRQHVPRLLRAQQIARAANFEVAHRNFESRAKLRVLTDGFESLFCDFGQNLSTPEGQIRVGMAARPCPRDRAAGAAGQGRAYPRPQ